jgi:hypothetical protein
MADNPNNAEQSPLSIERVLFEEAEALSGDRIRAAARPAPHPGDQHAQRSRIFLNADAHAGDLPAAEARRREAFYRWLNGLHRAALCCSGGGIRSATFCLGVIQALAGHDVRRGPHLPQPAAGGGGTRDKRSVERQTFVSATVDDTTTAFEIVEFEQRNSQSAAEIASASPDQMLPRERDADELASDSPIEPANSLLGRFHFLSTVSGGGYVGSWLSSWRKHDHFDAIIRNLTSRPKGADVEPPEISWLRAYSNYLTPSIGIGSADTWAAVAIVVRNLLLNWLIIIPVVCCALLVLKMIAAVSVTVAHSNDHGWLAITILAYGILCLVAAQAFTTRHRPPRLAAAQGAAGGTELRRNNVKCILCGRSDQPENCCCYDLSDASEKRAAPYRTNVDDTCFFYGDLIWAVLSAIAVTIFFASNYFAVLFRQLPEGAVFGLTAKFELPLLTAAAGFVIYTIGWIAGRPKFDGRDWILWAASGLIYGALVGLGAYLFSLLDPASCPGPTLSCLAPLLVAIIFGVPWVLLSQLLADTVFGGLVSYEPLSDADREWLGRAAGWLAAFAIGWAILAFLVFAGGYYVQDAVHELNKAVVKEVAAAGGVSGIVTALLGKSALTPATSSSGEQNSWTALACNIALAIAGPVFAAVLVVMLSVALDKLLLGDSLIALLMTSEPPTWSIIVWLAIGGGIAWAIAAISSRCFNINRFSLHALYRNRLIRAYLGASRQKRHPDNFTGLDGKDNVRMHELWPPKPGGSVHSNSLFHIVNIALNVVSTKRLSWQERKAEAFTVSPKHSGSAYLGFRRSEAYGDGLTRHTRDNGIALGTAMAISGAAVSSNMGYHSSPSLALLLTLFNVRLGWWLGNPGEAGNKEDAFRREGPRLAAKPLFYEAFGLTTDESAYVYLSDGGHFENLGLYEMVRRRCRFIIVIDAGCDPHFTFDDLGNAVRKIYIDLGVRIDFKGLDELRNRPSDEEIKAAGAEKIPYHAIGTIRYLEADGNPGDDPRIGDGYILYIKPAFHGREAAGIMAYAKENEEFPHESTADQWFTESQFESYRSLGFEIGKHILKRETVLNKKENFTLHDLLSGLQAP